jgi:hypothetical protein
MMVEKGPGRRDLFFFFEKWRGDLITSNTFHPPRFLLVHIRHTE